MPRPRPPVPAKGQRFGRLTSTGMAKEVGGRLGVLCHCDCLDDLMEVAVRVTDLTEGRTISCGCYQRLAASAANEMRGMNLSRTRLYSIWVGMKRRCYNPKHDSYAYYGGRGVTISEEWLGSFLTFQAWAMANGYTDELTIDRIDNGKGYYPVNCRWATWTEQVRNREYGNHTAFGETKSLDQWLADPRCLCSRRTLFRRVTEQKWPVERALQSEDGRAGRKILSHTKMYEAFGESKSRAEWAIDPRCVVSSMTFYQRVERRGWDVERALTTP